MARRSTSLLAALAILASFAGSARADDPVEPDYDDEDTHAAMAVFEAAVALGIPTYSYWSTEKHQAVDFELGNDWDSWIAKLTTTNHLKFDTNPMYVNSFRHPVAGIVDYHILRTNGFSPLSATAFAYAKGAFWEYCVEYREDPSINDLIFNGATGLAIGEPMYRIAQLWRGGRVTVLDRARTALFSPFDAFHDTYRRPRRWMRPSVWRTIDVAAGAFERRGDRPSAGELAAAIDIAVISNRAFAEGEVHDDAIHAGEWSRLRLAGRFGDPGDGFDLISTQFRTETSFMGRYHQDGDGNGRLLALGAGFGFRKDQINTNKDRDRFAIAHLIGPQLQLSWRRPGSAVLWDAAMYADFGLAQALVFTPDSPFPKPPPYYSSLQADGYIDAFGLTGTTRLRALTGSWRADLEVDGHILFQAVNHDRDGGGTGSSTGSTSTPRTVATPVTVYGVTESRGIARAQLFYQPGLWGFGVVGELVHRRSTWEDKRREFTDLSLGAMIQLAY